MIQSFQKEAELGEEDGHSFLARIAELFSFIVKSMHGGSMMQSTI